MLPRFALALCAAALATPAGAQGAPGGAPLATVPEGMTRVSEMIGTAVTGSDIRRLGKVKDVVLDREGRAVALVLGSGGMLGIGEKDVAVPYAGILWNYDVGPTDGPSSSNTGGTVAAGGGLEAKRADVTSPGAENVQATGTVGDPQQPAEGLRPQNATTPVTGGGAPTSAVLPLTETDLKNAPAFQSP
ncbi:MAG TPA: PRC-barrel domain-containing protein [Microvirga sp.]|jgi:sporulation protein YlmC with PRC-barrel domain|nr:PRC-barrel domain-containing protein [Microvirga sp.]